MVLNRKRSDYARHSAKVCRGPRWKALRLIALDRDNWACVECGTQRRLEVDHIQPVKTHPELSFDINNLQCLCGACHARKTRIEIGHKALSYERQRWRDFANEPLPPNEYMKQNKPKGKPNA